MQNFHRKLCLENGSETSPSLHIVVVNGLKQWLCLRKCFLNKTFWKIIIKNPVKDWSYFLCYFFFSLMIYHLANFNDLVQWGCGVIQIIVDSLCKSFHDVLIAWFLTSLKIPKCWTRKKKNTKICISWSQKERSKCNKKHFPYF